MPGETKEAKLVRPAARRLVDAALRRDDSLFTPGRRIWSLDNLDDLHRRFVEQPDLSADRFEDKLHRQLAGAPAETVQLAAECLYVYFLVPWRIKAETKRRGIETVLSWSPEPVGIPEDLSAALAGGIVTSGGTGYNTYKPFLIAYLIELAQELKRLASEERGAVLDDPWRFRELTYSLTPKGASPMREALLHLVHPKVFEQIVSHSTKVRIAKALASYVTRSGLNVDEQLLEIRRALAEEYGPELGFYDSPIRDRWQPESSRWGQFVMWAKRFHEDPGFDADERDYKLEIGDKLRQVKQAFKDGDPSWHRSLKDAFGPPNNLTHFVSHGRLLDWLESGHDATDALKAIWNEQSSVEERIRGFCSRLPKSVASGPGTSLNLASFLNLAHDPENEPPYRWTQFRLAFKLTGFQPPDKELDEADLYLHALRFLDTFDEKAAERGLELRDRLDAQGVMWCMTHGEPAGWSKKDRAAFLAYRQSGEVIENGGEDRTLAHVADQLFLTESFLENIQRLLLSKKQVIFYGPPGTGKTFVARELARFFAEDDHDAVTLVQFHREASVFGEHDDLVDAVAVGFVHQVRRAIRPGRLQGYRTRDEALAGLRGRVRFEDQLRYRFGRFPPAEVSYDDFTVDIEENRLLRAAIARLGQLRIRAPETRRSLRALADAFADVTRRRYSPSHLPEITYSRLNARYRPAVELAKLILKATSFDLAGYGVAARGFLVDMNRLFEDFVVIALREALGLSERSFPQNACRRRLTLDEAGAILLMPDLSWWVDGSRCRFVGDVKYKRSVEGLGKHGDLYQLLSYTVATGLPEGTLIYAAGESEPGVHHVRHLGKCLKVLALDLSGSPREVLGHIASVAAQIRDGVSTASAAGVAVQ